MTPPTPLGRFTERLDRLDVSHTTTDPAGVTDAVEAVLDPPAVGVALPDGLGDLPEAVETRPSPEDLRAARTGVTEATLAIADYGSIVLPSTPEGVEPVSLFPERHVAVLDEADLVESMATAIDRLGERIRADGGSHIVATGPSATADMGALVQGAHGPEHVHVVVVRP